ncbi:hypothetical protein H2201_002050 [Coniosporium apollinis]|uniref:Heterokaryon incompatibility domain-containing protein n=1 Tax=Coniosporium apollinis TaxID=61459 RepID=A0ABQ9P2U1_9PEZI|nr:hypothetical protein H2201_002050 [Coniosporium apollinis]
MTLEQCRSLGFQFQALSYAWEGDVTCNELQTPDGLMSITASLSQALCNLRSPRHAGLIWADAICINQHNNQEKSHQVRRMRDIYQKATQVMVYLGDETVFDRSGMAALHMVRNIDFGNGGPTHPFAPLVGYGDPQHPGWKAVRRLFQCPWFRRVWVVQEFVVATRVRFVFGRRELDWQFVFESVAKANLVGLTGGLLRDFTKANPWELGITDRGMRSFLTMCQLRREYHRGKRWSLFELATQFASNEASRARDHLFGLLGLAEDGDDPALEPDYNEPLESIVRRCTLHFIKHNNPGCLRVLCFAGLGSSPSRFPSWIPDWTVERHKESTLIYSPACKNNFYDAAGGRGGPVLFHPETNVLRVFGLYVDTVAHVGRDRRSLLHGVPGPDVNAVDQIMHIQDAEELVRLAKVPPDHKDLDEVLWRTLVGDGIAEGRQAPQEYSVAVAAARRIATIHRTWLGHVDDFPCPPPLEQMEKEDVSESEIARLWEISLPCRSSLYWLLRTCRKFCVTERGYAGLIPSQAQPGDLVYVLYGVPVPLILRKSPTRENGLLVVGESYIHGLMRGEAFTLSETGHDLLEIQ